ncbi:AsmA family protein [Shewanella colwelliana]|uniref:AsmA family protein n=1 Tax=Shewanella colwelliana TaxID=23 RepID=UPI003D05E772
MKIVKWILIAFVSLFILLVGYLTLVFDPNDFKPQIVDAVKEQTGRELRINQDLSWTFFPSIGIALGDISLSNPTGFKNSDMVKVNNMVAEVALMPLLSKEVEISQLNLDGLTVYLDTYKDGRTSLDGLNGKEGAKPESQAPDQAGSGAQIKRLNIGGVTITNTQIHLFDEASTTTQLFVLEKFALGEFSLGQVADFSYRFTATLPDMFVSSEGAGQLTVAENLAQIKIENFAISNGIKGEAIPNKAMTVALKTSLTLDLNQKQVSGLLSEFSANEIQASGKFDVDYGAKVPAIVASLELGDIDLDKLMPKSDTDQEQTTQTASGSAKEPDLSGMKAVNLKFDMRIKSVTVAKLKTTNWMMKLGLKDGVLDLSQLSADLYQGKLQAKAQLDGRQSVASYRFDKSISGIQVRPLLTDAAGVDMLAGTTNFSVSGSGKSLIPDNIKRNLVAKGQFEVADGALYGVNIPQMIRDAQAKLSGDLSASGAGEKKTDFTSLTGSFSMAKGVVTNPDLAMASPLIRLAGKGTVNAISEAIDYKLTTSVVGSLEGQGGGERDALQGIEIPFSITGTATEPKFGLDTEALFDAKLKQETEKATEKLKDGLFKKLGGF